MEDPTKEIEGVVRGLTQGSPKVQERTLCHYFTPHAGFKHPFCSVPANRDAILCIFQWYKILSPQIDISINTITFDQENLLLYLNMSQIFKIWFVPFYSASVTLTTVLQLQHGQQLNHSDAKMDPSSPDRYYICHQEDMYQIDQFIRFIVPFGGASVIMIWHWFATLCCIIGAKLGSPLTAAEQRKADRRMNHVKAELPPPGYTRVASKEENGQVLAVEAPKINGGGI